MNTVWSWLRVALIDLRGGLGRFGVLLACLALGVGTIAAVGSVGDALQAAIERDARVVLGGDLEARLPMRAAAQSEVEFLRTLGTLSAVTETNSRAIAGDQTAFLSLIAVDEAYPLVGQVLVTPPEAQTTPLPQLLAAQDGVYGAVVESRLLDRLGLKLGETFFIGDAEFAARAVLDALPDAAARGFQLGLTVMVSQEGITAAGVVQPGALTRFRYKLLLDEGTDFAGATSAIAERFPDAGWRTRSPADATENLSEFFDLFSRFLTLVGLSSLLVGGVGVSNAVSAYVTERQRSIATMRAIGATGARIMTHFMVQILVLSALGVGLGLVLGAVSTLLALPLLSGLLSLSLTPSLHLPALAIAAGFGILIAFAFAFLPLRRAEGLKPASLFRAASSAVEGGLGWRQILRPGTLVPLLLAALGIGGLAMLVTDAPRLVLWYAGGAVAAFLVMRGAAFVLQWLLRAIPPLPNANLRNALKAIHRPGSPAPVVMLSLGLGLSLLLMIALIDANLRRQLDSAIATEAPAFVVMDVLSVELPELEQFAAAEPRITDFSTTPILRGTIEALKGTPVDELTLPQSVAWMFNGDTNLTWSAELPAGSAITQGQWWPSDYDGEPLVSLSAEMAEPLGLSVGDSIEIALFGRPITATIASFRDFSWREGNMNFMIVFSPGLIESAPANYLATINVTPGTAQDVERGLARQFPELNFIPVGEAIERAGGIIQSLANAVALVGGLAVISGVFVLAGAMTAGRKQREADAVVMKVLGATPGDVVRAYLVEYGLLGLVSALLATALGTGAAWGIVTYVLELRFTPDLGLIAGVLVGATALTILTGMLTTWSALRTRPARFLRSV